MDEVGCVNIFLSEGAGISDIVAEMEKAGQEVARDAFGHIRLERINPGAWFGKQFAEMLRAEKVLVQKSGYYARSAAANDFDLDLIKSMTDLAVDAAIAGNPGVIGHDEENGDVLGVIAFNRIAGGKPFDISQQWYLDLLASIGQPAPVAAPPAEH
jgi:pyrophosphate--fructose-6-phosphate 1-phosphotransferase